MNLRFIVPGLPGEYVFVFTPEERRLPRPFRRRLAYEFMTMTYGHVEVIAESSAKLARTHGGEA